MVNAELCVSALMSFSLQASLSPPLQSLHRNMLCLANTFHAFSSAALALLLFTPHALCYFLTGVPPVLAAMTLAYSVNLFGSITHYASGQAAVFYGSGFMSLQEVPVIPSAEL